MNLFFWHQICFQFKAARGFLLYPGIPVANNMEEKMKKIAMLRIIGLVLAVIFSTASAVGREVIKPDQNLKDDLYTSTDLFFEVTRPIMLKDEVKIYKHLPDQAARESFIEDYWKKRDPSPGTEENENRREFARRVSFANQWFAERALKGRGWNSDRGKVYLLLGEPDERSTRQGIIIDRLGYRKRVTMETWLYDYHHLYLEFADEEGLGRYQLRRWPVELLSAIDRAKFNINPTEKTEPFKFKADIKNNDVFIDIPTKLVNFKEDQAEDKIETQFKITLFIYHQYTKIHQVEETRVVTDTRQGFSNREKIRLSFPIPLSAKGKYLFDIVVEELGSGAKYRDMIKYKL